MLTRSLVRKQLWISMFVMLYVLAMTLPAATVSAAGEPPACGESFVQAVSAAGGVVAAADQDVTISKDAVDLAVFTANWRSKLTNAQQVEALVADLFVVYSDKIHADEGANLTEVFKKAYEEAIEFIAENPNDFEQTDIIIHTILSVGLDIPDIAPAVPFVWQELTERGSRAGDVDFDAQIGQSATRFNLTQQLLNRSPEIIARVYGCAREIPSVANAFNLMHSKELNAFILDSAEELMGKNDGLPIPAEIRDGIREDGTIEISLNDLKKLSEAEFEKIHASIDDMQETLAEIDKDQDVILDYIKDQELKAKWQEVMKKKAAENQLKLDAAKATISILTTIAGQIDPDFAKGLNTVATSTLQVGMAINGWLKAVSGLKGLNKIASLSTVVMTGNVVGAVMNVVGLFTPDKPTPEQQILEEIGKLRQQVDELRVEMHARFDRIDVELNAIYTTMHDRFDQIDIQLGKINGNIGELQQSLLALDLKLSRIERNNFEFLNALGRRPLLDAINGGLGYAARTGQPMPFQPEFVEFENVLHSWGTIHAFDPLNAGPTQRDFSDGQMLAELSAFPLDSNINYLNGWLMAHGLPGVTNKRLPSPRDWLFASRAYMQLALEWPEHMKQIDPQRQTELDAIGVELEAAMRGISTQVTAASPQANSLLFSTVITQYQDKLDAVDSSLQALETAFMNEVRGQRLQRNEPFDLYGGVDQPLTYAASEVATATCGDAGVYGSHPAPGNLKSLLPNFARYNLADYLHLGKLNVCISYAMGDPIEQCYTEPEPPHAEICDTYYDVKAVVTTYFDNVSIMSQTIEGGGGYQTTDWYVHYGELEPNWTQGENFKAQFEALTTVDVPSPELAAQRAELLNTTTNKLETALGGYQQEMYARILNEMTKGSLAPLAVEAAGSKALLDSFVTLGLPRAAGDDEFLHAMLYGNQQLVDDGQIMQSYALSLTQPITGTGLLVNPRLVIGQVAAERSTAFTGMVNEYLDAITAQTHSELPDYIANTRRALDLTMRIVQLDVPVGPTPTPPGPTPTPPGPTPTPTPPTPEPSPSNVHRGLLPFLNR